jgi:tetratricopeptide (TPR) repeat protein
LILFVAAALAAAVPAHVAAPAPKPVGQAACPDVVTPDALVCRALDAQNSGNDEGAAQAFEEAAKASPDKDPKTARLFAAAGNMWIAAGQPGKAALDLDRALALPGLEAEQRGEAQLDRARAAEAQGDLAAARARLTEARASIAEDPFYWYFSAALAIREGDLTTAQTSIGQALKLAPSDPTILFEAGHVAHFAGEDARARYYWERAASGDSRGAIGKSARDALAMLPAPALVVTPPPPKSPPKAQPKS